MIDEAPKLKQDMLINISIQQGHEDYATALQYTHYDGDLAVVTSKPLTAICPVMIISSDIPEHIGDTLDIYRHDLSYALDNSTYGKYNKRLTTFVDKNSKVVYYSPDKDFMLAFYDKVKGVIGTNSLPQNLYRTILEAREKYSDDYCYLRAEDHFSLIPPDEDKGA